MDEVKHVIVVTDADSGQEAMYIGGDRVAQHETVYACDIAEHVGESIIQFSHCSVSFAEDYDSGWPDRFEEMTPHLVESVA